MRRIFPLLALVALGAVGTLLTHLFGVNQTKNPADPVSLASTENRAGTVDGALTPELIPDVTAYSLFFKFIARHNTADELDSYLQQRSLQGIDAYALLKMAKEYEDDRRPLEKKINALTALQSQQPQIKPQLEEVKRRKELLVSEKIALLRDRLGQSGAERIQQYVREYVKQQIKVFPERSKRSAQH